MYARLFEVRGAGGTSRSWDMSGKIQKLVAPNDMQIGLDDGSFKMVALLRPHSLILLTNPPFCRNFIKVPEYHLNITPHFSNFNHPPL